MKAPSVYGGLDVLVRMSLSKGGDAGFVDAEAGGMRARLAGRDAVIIELPSLSSSTDVGRDGGPRRNGFEFIGVGGWRLAS